jgi:adenylate cyclase
MAGIIQRETRGTIDKYIGDAIMAIWNAPEPVPDHAVMACQAALRCQEAGAALSQSDEWGQLPPFETRIGLHSGEALIGNFGAHDRFNYTAIGDAINLAARLESLNKQYGTHILASEQIVAGAQEHFAFRRVDLVAVKGKAQATCIFELLAPIGSEMPAHVGVYERALERYLEREFGAAAELLGRQLDDAPSAVLWRRCVDYLATPPPQGWNGVYVAVSK